MPNYRLFTLNHGSAHLHPAALIRHLTRGGWIIKTRKFFMNTRLESMLLNNFGRLLNCSWFSRSSIPRVLDSFRSIQDASAWETNVFTLPYIPTQYKPASQISLLQILDDIKMGLNDRWSIYYSTLVAFFYGGQSCVRFLDVALDHIVSAWRRSSIIHPGGSYMFSL